VGRARGPPVVPKILVNAAAMSSIIPENRLLWPVAAIRLGPFSLRTQTEGRLRRSTRGTAVPLFRPRASNPQMSLRLRSYGSGRTTMAAKGTPHSFRLNAVDRHGRNIDPTVLAAAEEVFPRALNHGLKLLGDAAVIANALEEVAAVVSRVVASTVAARSDPVAIKNLPGYIFRAFVRHVNRLKRKQLVLVTSDGNGQASAPHWADPSRDFETKILVDECLAQCDFVAQDMFWRRVQGFSWADIGKIHGLTAHAAEVRFRHALQRAHARLTNGRRQLETDDSARLHRRAESHNA